MTATENRADIFTSTRPLLFSIAYRMLGSVADAEDVVQDAFARWLEAPETEVRAPRAYLATIVSRLAINQLQSARTKRETYVGQWLPEPLVTEHAHIVDKSEANCRQLLTRAKKHLGESRTRFDVDPSQADRLLNRFTDAARAGDIDGLLGVLAEDITLWADGGGKVPGAALRPIHGADSVARFVAQRSRGGADRGGHVRLTRINGQPGFIVYVNGQPQAALILGVREGRIHDIYAIANPDKLRALSPLS